MVNAPTLPLTNLPTGFACSSALRYALRELLDADEDREPEDADAVPPGDLPALRAGRRHPHRRVRLLQRLRDDAARRDLHELAVEREGLLGPHARDDLERLLPHRARALGVDLEAGLLVLARPSGTELEAAVAQDVERRRPLGNPDRVVELVRQERHAVPEADALGALRQRAQEHLGGRAVRELGQEVVLDEPHGVEAELVGELDLLERLLVAAVLATLVVRLGRLQLVQKVELHTRTDPRVLRAEQWPEGSLRG
jgi:hypothetical protein